MSPEERKEKLKEEFNNKKEDSNDKGFKLFSDLDIHINEETIKEWRNNR